MDAVAADNDKKSPTKNHSESPTKEIPEITEEKQIEGTEKVSGNFKILAVVVDVWADLAVTKPGKAFSGYAPFHFRKLSGPHTVNHRQI